MSEVPRLAETLQELRRAAGLSLRQLEERSGVSRAIISRLENGVSERPTPANLSRLAQGLGVEAGELLTAAGYTASSAEALPAIRPYLRTKYGHLSSSAQDELADFLEKLEQEQSSKTTNSKQAKGGRHANK